MSKINFIKWNNSLCFLVMLFCFIQNVNSKVKLPSFFSDNMVLQQRCKLKIYGISEPKSEVRIITGWDNKKYHTSSSLNGEWEVLISTPKAGGPYDIVISDGEELKLKNILIGEVWFCSGQSNMEMPLAGWGKVINYETEIADASYPGIRLLQVKKTASMYPKNDVEIDFGWSECSPENISGFSSTAYFFARKLWKELKIPIGLIHSSWGGTPAEEWISESGLEKLPSCKFFYSRLKDAQKQNLTFPQYEEKKFYEWVDRLNNYDDGMKGDVPVWAALNYDDSKWNIVELPSESINHSFDGVTWYRKIVEIPEKLNGKQLKVNLGKIDDDDIVYFNGTEIGRTFGYYKNRQYSIPDSIIHVGKNIITVRNIDTGGKGGMISPADKMYISCEGEKAISLSGIWKYRNSLDIEDGNSIFSVRPQTSYVRPVNLFNAMVNPFLKFPIAGVIWYQGEANEWRANDYGDLFVELINDWRKHWENPELPFYFVQLASYRTPSPFQEDSRWALVREAQMEALRLDNTGMAVTTDIGNATDIHPKNKQEVGRRLALIALDKKYNVRKCKSDVPRYEGYSICGNTVCIDFSDDAGGFADTKSVKGFVIAGSDRIFYEAKAKIKGNKIYVSSEKVEYPVAVRYGWADYPLCNLFGRAGIPVSPFRTDKW